MSCKSVNSLSAQTQAVLAGVVHRPCAANSSGLLACRSEKNLNIGARILKTPLLADRSETKRPSNLKLQGVLVLNPFAYSVWTVVNALHKLRGFLPESPQRTTNLFQARSLQGGWSSMQHSWNTFQRTRRQMSCLRKSSTSSSCLLTTA